MANTAEPFLAPNGLKRTGTWLAEKETPKLIQEFVDRYSLDHWDRLAKFVADLLEQKLAQKGEKPGEEGIQALVKCRAKSKKSLREKLELWNETKPYTELEQIELDIVDRAGVRIVLYTPSKSQFKKVEAIIHEIFGEDVKQKVHASKPQQPRGSDQYTKQTTTYQPIHLGYQGVHYRPFMREGLKGRLEYNYEPGDRVEIQVTSALGHAWAEAGHDLVYKSYAFGPASVQELLIYDALSGLVQSGNLLLEQLQGLQTGRTTAKIEDLNEFDMRLKEMDVLRCPEGSLFDKLIPRDCSGVLLKVFQRTGKNFPLAIRKAIRQLGYPDAPCLDKVLAVFKPTFEPVEEMKFIICLIYTLLEEEDYEKLRPIRPREQHQDLDCLPAADKCLFMINALGLLQDVLGNEHDQVRKFLLADVTLTDKERNSLDWVLTDVNRLELLDDPDDDDQKIIQSKVSEGWSWFRKEAGIQNQQSLCGLAFKLAILEAIQRPDLIHGFKQA